MRNGYTLPSIVTGFVFCRLKFTTSPMCLSFFLSKSVCLLGLECIIRDGKPVGFIRRADYAFSLDKPMACG